MYEVYFVRLSNSKAAADVAVRPFALVTVMYEWNYY